MKKFALMAGILVVSGSTFAQVHINEIFFNPPSTDEGYEFVELRGDAGFDLTGLQLVEIDADGTSAGRVNAIHTFGTGALGQNGLYLRRDATRVLDTSSAAGHQGPAAQTTTQVLDFVNTGLQNGGSTYLLGKGFTGSLNTFIDGGLDGSGTKDGAIDATYTGFANFTLFQALAFGDTNDDILYANSFAAANPGRVISFGSVGFAPEAYVKLNGAPEALLVDISNTTNDTAAETTTPYTFSGTAGRVITADYNGGFRNFDITSLTGGTASAILTPGAFNPVPEPATLIALSVGLGALIRRRNRK